VEVEWSHPVVESTLSIRQNQLLPVRFLPLNVAERCCFLTIAQRDIRRRFTDYAGFSDVPRDVGCMKGKIGYSLTSYLSPLRVRPASAALAHPLRTGQGAMWGSMVKGEEGRKSRKRLATRPTLQPAYYDAAGIRGHLPSTYATGGSEKGAIGIGTRAEVAQGYSSRNSPGISVDKDLITSVQQVFWFVKTLPPESDKSIFRL
jgi:hypothetical protein